MAIPDDILKNNALYLESLDTESYPLGITTDGRIVSGKSLFSLEYLSTMILDPEYHDFEVLGETSKYLFSKKMEDLTHSGGEKGKFRVMRAHARTLIEKLEVHGTMTAEIRGEIIHAYLQAFTHEYERLGSPSTPEILHEKMEIITAMLEDPLIPDDVKESIGFKPTDPGMGASASFFVHGPDRKVLGIFKPQWGEVGMPGCPSDDVEFPLDPGSEDSSFGVKHGTGYKREVAASLFAKKLGYVPPTIIYETQDVPRAMSAAEAATEPSSSVGSLQAFVQGASSFVDKCMECGGRNPFGVADPESVQGVSLRHILTGMLDGHRENVLFKEDQIIAIDHGLSFPAFFVTRDEYIKERIVSHCVLSGAGAEVLGSEVREKFLALDVDSEVHALLKKDLISHEEALSIRTRHYLLYKLILIDPPLSIFEIMTCFMKSTDAETLLHDEVKEAAFASVENEREKASNEAFCSQLYVAFCRATDEIVTHEKIEETIRGNA